MSDHNTLTLTQCCLSGRSRRGLSIRLSGIFIKPAYMQNGVWIIEVLLYLYRHSIYSGTSVNNYLRIKASLLYNGQAPRSQMNSLCTKQPVNKGHPCIKAKTLFPKGVRYRGFHALYHNNTWHSNALTIKNVTLNMHGLSIISWESCF